MKVSYQEHVLSRRKPGFDSPWHHHLNQEVMHKAYKTNSIKAYFTSLTISEPANFADCIYQEFFIDNYKKRGGEMIMYQSASNFAP